MAKLSDIFTLQMGKTPARAKDEYWNNGDNNWVSISDLSTYNKYVGDTKETISDLAVKDSGIKPVPTDTVIMSFKLTLGKTAITVKPTFTNEAIMAFIPNGNYPVCPSYFYHFFGGRDWSKGTNRAVMGVTLNKATLGEIDVATPSLEEQTKIAEHLDRVDELISLQKQQLTKLDQLVKSRFIELMDSVELSEELTVEQITERVKVGFVGTCEKYYTDESGVPMLRTGNITDRGVDMQDLKYVTSEFHEKNKKSQIRKGDLLIARHGSNGQANVYDGPDAQCLNAVVIVPNQNIARSVFLAGLINSPMVMKKSRAESERSMREGKRELEQAQTRIRKLDEIIQKLYEDNLEGKISDERFAKMSANYEAEQHTLEQRVAELKALFAAEKDNAVNVDFFLSKVKKYTDIQDLTAEVIREFVEKVYVHQTEYIDGQKVQRIRIVYNCIGEFTAPTEMEQEKSA